MSYQDEVMPYKKKAKSKTPAKTKHKHIYQPCVIEIPDDWYKKDHVRSGETRCYISSYCPICGKVGPINIDRWWDRYTSNGRFCFESTEEAKAELNPLTRTLPTFHLDDPFEKYVDIEEDKT